MKLIPNYSYEFNYILNDKFTEDEQIKNFTSLLTDKDRFLSILPVLENNLISIEKELGYKIKEKINFYIVRAEKFKSFSLPITIEYSIIPEEMILYLLKEIIKTSITDRFPDESKREIYINSFIEHLIKELNWKNINLNNYLEKLHKYSKKKYNNYENKKIDFKSKNMKTYLEELFNEEIYSR